MKKYVVSEEKWNFGELPTPNDDFLQGGFLAENLFVELEKIFGEESVDFIFKGFLKKGLKKRVAGNCPIVSLEKFFIDTPFHLEASRAVDINLNNIGLRERTGAESIDNQVIDLLAQGLREIVLVDDVLFSGGVWEIIEKLLDMGIRVKKFICGISIGDGKKRLEKQGIKVSSVVHYEEVIDEVCHRDFYAGVPYSGRTVVDGSGRNIGAPYFYPFGKPVEWASIPENRAKEFSDFCLRQSIELWKHIERLYGKSISCFQIDRLPIGAPNDNTRFVNYLTSLL